MNLLPTVNACRSYLDSIVLRPSVTLGLSLFDKRTGRSSGQKSLSLKKSATLLQFILFMAWAAALLYTLCRLMHWKTVCSVKRKLKRRKKWLWKK